MKINKIGIKWQIFGYLTIFVGVVLAILWIFQVILLEDFYKRIKINELKNVAEKIEKNIDKDYVVDLLNTISRNNELCIVLTNANGEAIYKNDELGDSTIYNMTSLEYYLAGSNAEKEGGSLLYYFNFKEFEKLVKRKYGFINSMPLYLKNKDDAVIYVKNICDNKGNDYVLLINGIILPVDATVSTLRKQLLYITIIMVMIAFVLARVMARKIAMPLTRMSNKAKGLVDSYEEKVVFDEKGYKEVATLSESLSYASVELTKTEALRRELIANISHDLRTPLTLITGYSEMMRDLPSENTSENVQVIIDESKRLTQLVNDMLDLSKLQAGASQLDRNEFSITKEIDDVLLRYNTLKSREGYIIDFEYNDIVYVNGDKLKLSQVLYNLINNAINYSGDKKRVLVKQIINDDKVRIEVRDWGMGISEEFLPYIWERYYKVDKIHQRETVGTGLGLSIVKTILDKHGARYGVSSELGKGTIFWFELTYVKHSDDIHVTIT